MKVKSDLKGQQTSSTLDASFSQAGDLVLSCRRTGSQRTSSLSSHDKTITILLDFQSKHRYHVQASHERYKRRENLDKVALELLVSSMQCRKAEGDAEGDACTAKYSDRTLEHGPRVGNNPRNDTYEAG